MRDSKNAKTKVDPKPIEVMAAEDITMKDEIMHELKALMINQASSQEKESIEEFFDLDMPEDDPLESAYELQDMDEETIPFAEQYASLPTKEPRRGSEEAFTPPETEPGTPTAVEGDGGSIEQKEAS